MDLNFFENEMNSNTCCQMMNCPMYISYRLEYDGFKENAAYIEFKLIPAGEIED